jgi:hypothetical protein
MPVYYSKVDEEEPVFHVFLGCPEGSKIEKEDRVEKVKKRSVCQECLILMKHARWAPTPDPCRHEETHRHRSDSHRG